MARPITLLSDYGYDDEFAGVCRAVIAGIAPEAMVIDLTHGVPRHAIRQGATILANALLSAMRTLAAEGHRANAIAIGDDPTHVEHWLSILQADAGVTGELIRLTPAHVGKALT